MDIERGTDEVVRARLAYVTAGQRPLCGPRRAVNEEADALATAEVSTPSTSPEAPLSTQRLGWLPALKLTTRHIVVLAILALVAVAVAVVAITRTSATAVPLVSASGEASSAPASAQASPAPAMMRVHVAGAVMKPGVVTVPEGSIVQDAIAAAGGLTPEADAGDLNLAGPLTDGTQIVIGTKGSPRGDVVGGAPSTAGSEGGRLNLNQATQAQLEDLPGIGPVTAQAIIAWREEHGGFTSVAELRQISGIGPKTFAKLEPLVTV